MTSRSALARLADRLLAPLVERVGGWLVERLPPASPLRAPAPTRRMPPGWGAGIRLRSPREARRLVRDGARALALALRVDWRDDEARWLAEALWERWGDGGRPLPLDLAPELLGATESLLGEVIRREPEVADRLAADWGERAGSGLRAVRGHHPGSDPALWQLHELLVEHDWALSARGVDALLPAPWLGEELFERRWRRVLRAPAATTEQWSRVVAGALGSWLPAQGAGEGPEAATVIAALLEAEAGDCATASEWLAVWPRQGVVALPRPLLARLLIHPERPVREWALALVGRGAEVAR